MVNRIRALLAKARRNPTTVWRAAVLLALAWIALQQQQILDEMPEDVSYEMGSRFDDVDKRLRDIDAELSDLGLQVVLRSR